jgi:hypothetical protein
MTVLQIIIIGMIVIIIATVTLAVLSYGAFKIRDRKSPRREGVADAGAPMFFERVRIAAAIRRNDG